LIDLTIVGLALWNSEAAVKARSRLRSVLDANIQTLAASANI
jgi:hypothetical protein